MNNPAKYPNPPLPPKVMSPADSAFYGAAFFVGLGIILSGAGLGAVVAYLFGWRRRLTMVGQLVVASIAASLSYGIALLLSQGHQLPAVHAVALLCPLFAGTTWPVRVGSFLLGLPICLAIEIGFTSCKAVLAADPQVRAAKYKQKIRKAAIKEALENKKQR